MPSVHVLFARILCSKSTVLLFGCCIILMPVRVLAADETSQDMAIEVSPFLSFDAARDLPGPIGLGVSAERLVNEHVGVAAMASFSHMRRLRSEVSEDSADGKLIGQRYDNVAATLRSAYYLNPRWQAHTGFIGLGLVLGSGDATYAYKRSWVKDRYWGALAEAELGYFWKLSPRWHFRITGRAWTEMFSLHALSADASPEAGEAKRQVKRHFLPDFLPSFNIGLGWTF